MSEIRSIDRTALGPGRGVDMANHMLNQSGLRIGFDRRRGRGAGLNPSGRYEPFARAAFDDGWNTIDELPPFRTEVQNETARTIITRNQSPDAVVSGLTRGPPSLSVQNAAERPVAWPG